MGTEGTIAGVREREGTEFYLTLATSIDTKHEQTQTQIQTKAKSKKQKAKPSKDRKRREDDEELYSCCFRCPWQHACWPSPSATMLLFRKRRCLLRRLL